MIITGDDPDGVDRAVEMVSKLLKPLDDDDNMHKQKQLRELALINGTLRTANYCSYCGEEGHKQYECPTRASRVALSNRANVRCAICGDSSHVTADCKLTREEVARTQREKETDFQAFMAECGDEAAQEAMERGQSVPAAPSSNTGASQGTEMVAGSMVQRLPSTASLPEQPVHQGIANANSGSLVAPPPSGPIPSLPPPPLAQGNTTVTESGSGESQPTPNVNAPPFADSQNPHHHHHHHHQQQQQQQAQVHPQAPQMPAMASNAGATPAQMQMMMMNYQAQYMNAMAMGAVPMMYQQWNPQMMQQQMQYGAGGGAAGYGTAMRATLMPQNYDEDEF